MIKCNTQIKQLLLCLQIRANVPFSSERNSDIRLKYPAVNQGWRQEISDGGLTLPTRGLKYGFQGTINVKDLRKISFHLPMGGLACSEGDCCHPSCQL